MTSNVSIQDGPTATNRGLGPFVGRTRMQNLVEPNRLRPVRTDPNPKSAGGMPQTHPRLVGGNGAPPTSLLLNTLRTRGLRLRSAMKALPLLPLVVFLFETDISFAAVLEDFVAKPENFWEN
ncbi:P0560B06.14 [Oryza sativa Japonica Group]|uniref:p0560B06.14 protein n=1 Tax=Oryza sativa subsp. japonica TaxID=39947 RepID=Q93VP5_ORYSJ|nr:P0560B06.14 [Oryza sativa Japonica Group]